MINGKALITGATGFIGCRLAEIACARGIAVVALVRSWHKAARLARLRVRMMQGDILETDSLREAMKGCDVVYHCASDSSAHWRAHRHVNVRGTANVLRAALETKIKRVVYLSSVAVHGFWPPLRLATEDAPLLYSGDPYCDGKIDAEKIVLRYYRERGLPVTVLRPSLVYGPFESLWAERLIASIRERRMVLVNGGKGICNSVYVDNVAEAILLAASLESAVGEAFIISDAHPIPWREMIESHARALGDSFLPLPEMAREEIEAARAKARALQTSSFRASLRLIHDPRTRRALRSIPVVARLEKLTRATVSSLPKPIRRLARGKSPGRETFDPYRGVVRTGSPPLLDAEEVNFYSCSVEFSIEKARQLLGYEARINFAEGMRRTAEWIRWLRL